MEGKMTFQQFIDKWNGKPCEVVDPTNLNQCFDLAIACTDALGIPRVFPFLYASQIYTKFSSLQAKYFDRIKNTPDAIPQAWDIIIWDGSIGHVSIGTDKGDLKGFTSFDQNWPLDSVCHYQEHNYDNPPVLGWLRPKKEFITAANTPPKEIIVGNDISEFQGDIDWNIYKNNTNFVIIRSTYGEGKMDLKFTANREGARNAGIPLGFYHYAYPHLNTALAEADWCLLQLSDIRENESIYLDFEEDKIPDPVAWCKAFLDRVAEKRNGYKALIYLNQALCKKYDWTPIVNAGYKLWIAAYTYNPRLNNYQIGAWEQATMQQWTNQQTVPGIANQVDGDVFFGTIEGFKSLGYQKPIVIPPINPCALQDETIVNLNQSINNLNSKLQQLQETISNQKELLLSDKQVIDGLTEQANKVTGLTKQIDEITDSNIRKDNEISVLRTQNGTLTTKIETIKTTLVPKKYLTLKVYNWIMSLDSIKIKK